MSTERRPDRPDPDIRPATVVVTAGRGPAEDGVGVNVPVDLNATYRSRGVPDGGPVYARAGNGSWTGMEEVVGRLEGAPGGATLFASGMAAIAAVLAQVPLGGRVVVPDVAYNTTLELAADLGSTGALRVDLVDVADPAAVRDAVDAGPLDLLWLETPTNPLLDVADVRGACAAAHQAGALVAVDNTFATPLGQRPLDLGADVVVHSVTKYLSGHSDVVLGAAVTADDALAAAIRTHRRVHGAVPGPSESWLALRGVRTLALRTQQAQRSALELATRLTGRPEVARVRHPGLPEHPGHELARRQMSGFGAIIAVELVGADTAEQTRRADALVDAVRLWTPATSLGGVESLIERRRRHGNEPDTVPDGLLRLSVGIEDVEDLWDDLVQALGAVTGTTGT